MTEQKKHPFIRLCLSFLLTIIFIVLGSVIGTNASEKTKNAVAFFAVVAMALLLLCFLFNLIASRIYKKSKDFSVRQMQEYYLTRREQAIKDLPKAVQKMIRIRYTVEIYSILIFLLSFVWAFCIGFGGQAGMAIFPMYITYGFLYRLKPEMPKFDFKEYTDPFEYPQLHTLAHRAAQALGMDGKIRIILLPDCNAGIARIGKTYSLQLGVILLDTVSEDELYQILLHEFAHLTKDGNPMDKEYKLYSYIAEQEENPMGKIINSMFSFWDQLYIFEYSFYNITVSIAIEEIADQAIIRHGNPQTAVNALAKTAYYNHFDREMDNYIEESFYESEEMRNNISTILCQAFRQATEKRSVFWKELMMKEIQPRSASHPIFRKRMESLGISDFTVIFPENIGEFRKECQKAIEDMNLKLYESQKDDYINQRKENYLIPLKIVEDWITSGKRISAEESRPVMDALWSLNRNQELEELCDSIINNTKNKFATAHARMIKGTLLLKRYDKSGIDYLYDAIEINHNYIDYCMNQIGNFCCLMGLQKELDEYRERALELGQKQVDKYSKTGELFANDNLQPDTMPAEMKESILSYIRSIDEGQIQRIFLVRKVITETYFSSVFVIDFRQNTDEETLNRVMDKIFNHLDTRPEEHDFSLFLYNAQTGAAVGKVKDSCVFDAFLGIPNQNKSTTGTGESIDIESSDT